MPGARVRGQLAAQSCEHVASLRLNTRVGRDERGVMFILENPGGLVITRHLSYPTYLDALPRYLNYLSSGKVKSARAFQSARA
jgi:hypothetical protein